MFIPVGACWLNLQEGWWRIFHKAALAGQTFAGPTEIEAATVLATAQLNARARPWIWGRPHPTDPETTPAFCLSSLRNSALVLAISDGLHGLPAVGDATARAQSSGNHHRLGNIGF